MACATRCITAIAPSPASDCTNRIRKGGISYQVVATCDIVADLLQGGIDPVTREVVPDIWLPYLQACKIRISPAQSEGSLASAGGNEQTLFACRLPQPTIYTHTFTFVQRKRTESELDADFYRYVQKYQQNLQVGFISCYNEKFYPFMPFIVNATSPQEGTVNGLWTLNSEFQIQTDPADSILPVVQVKGLANMLLNWASYDCSTGGYASDSDGLTYIEDLFGS